MKCKICNQKMKEISNTHLKKHNLTKHDYAKIDNDFKIYQSKKMSDMVKQRKQVWNKNKTYEELLGKKEAKRRNKVRSINIKNTLSKLDLKKTSEQKKICSMVAKKSYKEHPEIKEKISNAVKKWAKENKEHYIKMAINSRKSQSQSGFISKPQMELYLLIKSKYPEAELEYPIRTKHSVRFADIGIPSLKLDIEYDGMAWHTNKELDDLRDEQLAEVGWKTIRFNKDNIKIKLERFKELK